MRIVDLNYKEGLSRLAIILSIVLVLASIQLGEMESYFLVLGSSNVDNLLCYSVHRYRIDESIRA